MVSISILHFCSCQLAITAHEQVEITLITMLGHDWSHTGQFDSNRQKKANRPGVSLVGLANFCCTSATHIPTRSCAALKHQSDPSPRSYSQKTNFENRIRILPRLSWNCDEDNGTNFEKVRGGVVRPRVVCLAARWHARAWQLVFLVWRAPFLLRASFLACLCGAVRSLEAWGQDGGRERAWMDELKARARAKEKKKSCPVPRLGVRARLRVGSGRDWLAVCCFA